MSGGKVLVATGGSRGIGAAVCRAAARQSWRVALSYLSNSRAAEKLVEIAAQSGESIAVRADVGAEAGIVGRKARGEGRACLGTHADLECERGRPRHPAVAAGNVMHNNSQPKRGSNAHQL